MWFQRRGPLIDRDSILDKAALICKSQELDSVLKSLKIFSLAFHCQLFVLCLYHTQLCLLGVNGQGGCDAIVHTARSFISSCPAGSALLKIDFCNAFNGIRSDSMFEAVEAHVPELLPFLIQLTQRPQFFNLESLRYFLKKGV